MHLCLARPNKMTTTGAWLIDMNSYIWMSHTPISFAWIASANFNYSFRIREDEKLKGVEGKMEPGTSTRVCLCVCVYVCTDGRPRLYVAMASVSISGDARHWRSTHGRRGKTINKCLTSALLFRWSGFPARWVCMSRVAERKDVVDCAKRAAFYLCLAPTGWGHSLAKWRHLSDEGELSAHRRNSPNDCQTRTAGDSVFEIT